MRLLKGISLFLIYPLLLLGLGFYAGVKTTRFFYPGEQDQRGYLAPVKISVGDGQRPDSADLNSTGQSVVVGDEYKGQEPVDENYLTSDVISEDDKAVEAAFLAETLNVDTEYVIEESDIFNHSIVENTSRLPSMYVGMNREQFLQAMDTYAISPPLSELELGFVGVEVVSFSRERVVVRKNYKYLQPSDSFYLAVYDNEVVVYLEDKETVFIETDIRLDTLPDELQVRIIEMMWIEDEERLYSFLENYSS